MGRVDGTDFAPAPPHWFVGCTRADVAVGIDPNSGRCGCGLRRRRRRRRDCRRCRRDGGWHRRWRHGWIRPWCRRCHRHRGLRGRRDGHTGCSRRRIRCVRRRDRQRRWTRRLHRWCLGSGGSRCLRRRADFGLGGCRRTRRQQDHHCAEKAQKETTHTSMTFQPSDLVRERRKIRRLLQSVFVE